MIISVHPDRRNWPISACAPSEIVSLKMPPLCANLRCVDQLRSPLTFSFIRCDLTSSVLPPEPDNTFEIAWQDWGSLPFERAQIEDKPVLLSISAVWCHWCHWCHVMDKTSYSDQENADTINRLFIPVRVDSDLRPDINSRYNMGGWPTTAFLTPGGDLIAGATYLSPQELQDTLTRVSGEYHELKNELLQRSQSLRAKPAQGPPSAALETDLDRSIADNVVQDLAGEYDPQHGGFGTQPKFPMVSSVELLLHQRRTGKNDAYRSMAETSMDNMMAGDLHDHVEGGFFRYSTQADWSAPHFEKLLEDNARLLHLYCQGYLVTGKEDYASIASRVADYLNAHLYHVKSGAYYGCQDADEEYHSQPPELRSAHRPPAVDMTFYTGKNAVLASAYLEAAWILERPELAGIASNVLDYFLEHCREHQLCHSYRPDGEEGIPALLTDYAYLIVALADSYHLTSNRGHLAQAQHLAEQMRTLFWDEQFGSFFDIPFDAEAPGYLKVRYKPLGDNAAAAGAFTQLYYYTYQDDYRSLAEKTLKGMVSVYQNGGDAASAYAMAVDRFLNPSVEVIVVGERGDPRTKALLTAGATLPYPNVVLKHLDADDIDQLADLGYGPSAQPVVYVCMDTLCLAPIDDPDNLHRTVTQFLETRVQGTSSVFQELGDVGPIAGRNQRRLG